MGSAGALAAVAHVIGVDRGHPNLNSVRPVQDQRHVVLNHFLQQSSSKLYRPARPGLHQLTNLSLLILPVPPSLPLNPANLYSLLTPYNSLLTLCPAVIDPRTKSLVTAVQYTNPSKFGESRPVRWSVWACERSEKDGPWPV